MLRTAAAAFPSSKSRSLSFVQITIRCSRRTRRDQRRDTEANNDRRDRQRHARDGARSEAWWWTPQAAAPRVKAPVQCRQAPRVETQDPGVGGEAQGRAASYLHPHPTRRRQGRSAALAVAGDRIGERRIKVGLPSILQDLDYPSFFNPTESDPNLSKANGYPYSIRSKFN